MTAVNALNMIQPNDHRLDSIDEAPYALLEAALNSKRDEVETPQMESPLSSSDRAHSLDLGQSHENQPTPRLHALEAK